MRKKAFFLSLLVLSGLAAYLTKLPYAIPSHTSKPISRLGKLPLYFIQNQGQVNEAVAYYVQGASTSVYFSPDSVVYRLISPAKRSRRGFQNAAFLRDQPPTHGTTVTLKFINANPRMRVEGVQQTELRASFFRGPQAQWRTEIPSFSGILYRDVWPGIDVEFTGPDGKLKYNVLVHPGADFSRARFAYHGAKAVRIGAEGQLNVETEVGSFAEDKPIAWQEQQGQRTAVSVRFVQDRNEISFAAGEFDRSRLLVIDPVVLVSAGYVGGTGDDDVAGVAVDNYGNVYFCGATESSEATFPVQGGPDLTYNSAQTPGTFDAFVGKMNSSGTALVYMGYIGGSGTEFATRVALDATGNAYVVGWTNSSQATFPVLIGPDLTYNGGTDGFIAKINAAGTALVYSGYIGGSVDDRLNGVAVDANGNAYVAGGTGSTQGSFPVVNGPDMTYNGGTLDALVAKVNASGTGLIYAGYIGGSGDDAANGVVVDALGNAYIVGSTASSQSSFPVTAGPDLTYNGGSSDAFVAKVNAAGTGLMYCGYIGGSSYEQGFGLALDGQGNLYATGLTASGEQSFPVVTGPDTTWNGAEDAFVTKISSGGSIVYSGYIGGIDSDVGWAIAVDLAGNAYVAGDTASTQLTFPTVNGSDTTFNGGSSDAFLAKVRASGSGLVYSTYIGGSNTDAGNGVAIAPNGDAWVVGSTYSSEVTFPVKAAFDLTYNGGQDVFLARLSFGGTSGPVLAFRDSFGNIQTATFPSATPRNAGGVFASDPAVAMTPQGRGYFVARDTALPNAGGVYINSVQPDNAYSGWRYLGAVIQGTPSITTVGETAFVAARDQWGAYWATTFTAGGTAQPWTLLGGVLASDPAIAACPDGSVYVAGREPYGAIWTRRWDGAASVWRAWNGVGGITKGKPSVACGSDNAAYVSTRDPSDSMWLARAYQETGGTWTWGGGILNDDTQIVVSGNRLFVFALSYFVPWYREWQVGGGWQSWFQVGGVLSHLSPAVYNGNLFLTGQASNNDLWWWSGMSASWTNWGNNNVVTNGRFSTAYR